MNGMIPSLITPIASANDDCFNIEASLPATIKIRPLQGPIAICTNRFEQSCEKRKLPIFD